MSPCGCSASDVLEAPPPTEPAAQAQPLLCWNNEGNASCFGLFNLLASCTVWASRCIPDKEATPACQADCSNLGEHMPFWLLPSLPLALDST